MPDFESPFSDEAPAPRARFVNTVRGSGFPEISLDELAIDFFSSGDRGRSASKNADANPRKSETASQRRGRSVSRHSSRIVGGGGVDRGSSVYNASIGQRAVSENHSRRRRSVSVVRCPISDSEVYSSDEATSNYDGTITFHDKASNRVYKLNDQTTIAKLFVRPRGWHLPEYHILIDGEPAIGCLVDFGLYFYHNYETFRRSSQQGSGFGPFFYLPKMEHSREAKIWNCVFERAEKMAGIERGSVRGTVLVETLPAVFQMDEILYELRDHSVGLNCGRWDYIFSYVKTFQAHPDRILPDRVQIGMGQHFMRSYSELLIRTCHMRGVHAMGGMAAQIPIRDDSEANKAALELVRKDKLREAKAGHDGTWAAHPGLIPACTEVFNGHMGSSPNQIQTAKRDDVAVAVEEEDLLQRPRGVRTMQGLRLNTRVGIQYLAAWLTGAGSVPLYNLMEDAATAEISRVQNWQWLKYGVELDGGEYGGIGCGVRVTRELFGRVEEEMARIEREVDNNNNKFNKGMYREACKMFTRQCTAPTLDDFLTLDAYNHIVVHHPTHLFSNL